VDHHFRMGMEQGGNRLGNGAVQGEWIGHVTVMPILGRTVNADSLSWRNCRLDYFIEIIFIENRFYERRRP
jgi:hypothetical protein